ncbi:MAG: SRPBCC family protein [Gammaproteobacteria bacterium]
MPRTITLLLLIVLPAIANAHGPSRQKVTREITVNAPAPEVWAALADFCSIETWHPAVVACEGPSGSEPGATRILTIGEANGPQLHEELQKFDADNMTLKYKISKTDNTVMPVTTYSAFMTVTANDDGTSTVQWRGGFYRAYPNNNPPEDLNDEAAVTAVTNVYDAGLGGIKALVEN